MSDHSVSAGTGVVRGGNSLREAAEVMCERYAEILRKGGMLPENSPTIRAVRDALAEEEASPDPRVMIQELLNAVHAASLDRKGWDACKRAEAWLAEHGA